MPRDIDKTLSYLKQLCSFQLFFFVVIKKQLHEESEDRDFRDEFVVWFWQLKWQQKTSAPDILSTNEKRQNKLISG